MGEPCKWKRSEEDEWKEGYFLQMRHGTQDHAIVADDKGMLWVIYPEHVRIIWNSSIAIDSYGET